MDHNLEPISVYYYSEDVINKVKYYYSISTVLASINYAIRYYLSIPLIVLNILGNGLNLIIYLDKSFRKTSIGFYLVCLALVDTLNIYTIIYYYELKLFDIEAVIYELQIGNDYWKMVVIYFRETIPYFSPWISVLVALDRSISVYSIKSMGLLSNKKFQFSVVSITIFLLLLVNVDLLFQYYVYDYQEIHAVGLYNNYDVGVGQYILALTFLATSNYYKVILPYMNLFVSSVIPFLVMTIANTLTWIRLRRSKDKFKTQGGGMTKEQRRENRFLVIAVSLNILMLITLAPITFFETCGGHENVRFHNSAFDGVIVDISYSRLCSQFYKVAFYWRYLYSTSQVFLYFSINKVYRDVFRQKISFLSSKIKNLFRCF